MAPGAGHPSSSPIEATLFYPKLAGASCRRSPSRFTGAVLFGVNSTIGFFRGMDPENFDWNNIDSIFVEDDKYEYIDAPKWIDLSAPDEPVFDDDEAWFCKPDCLHPKAAEDFRKLTRNSKVKFLRSVTISEILPFRERRGRDDKLKRREIDSSVVEEHIDSQLLKTKGLNSLKKFDEDSENQNPNFPTPPPRINSSTMKKKQLDDSHANLSQNDRKPRLRSTFSARNLFAGREILNQVTEFCNELKKLGRKNRKKGSSPEEFSGGVLDNLKKRVAEREKDASACGQRREI